MPEAAESLNQPNVREGHVEVEGGKIWYKIVGANRPGIPLLTIHGGPGYPSTDLITLEQLASESNRPVIFYDQLGCGKSMIEGANKVEGEEGYVDHSDLWTIDRFVRELTTLRAHLKEKGYEKMHLFGHSWGSKLAVEYLLNEKPADIVSLTLASPVLSAELFKKDLADLYKEIDPDAQQRQREFEEKGDTKNPEYLRITHEFETRFILGQEIEQFPHDIQKALGESEKGFGKQSLGAMFGSAANYDKGKFAKYERIAELRNLGIPVLYTCGRMDESRPDTVKIYKDATPNSDMATFTQSAHMPHLTEPQLYNSQLKNFMERTEAPLYRQNPLPIRK